MIALKPRLTRSGDTVFPYRLENGQRITFAGSGPGGISFAAVQMYQLGNVAIGVLKERVAKGVGSDDSPMPPLSAKRAPIFYKGKFVGAGGYAGAKAAMGGSPIRNLYGPGEKGTGPWAKGHMLDNLSVRKVSDSQVQIGFTTDWARGKAQKNEQRSPWFAFSGGDMTRILAFAQEQLWPKAVKDFGAGRGSGRPIYASTFSESAAA